jgi:hypothetical protein
MKTLYTALLGLFLISSVHAEPAVKLLKAPEDGFRPQVEVTPDGTVHIVQGSTTAKGDLFYIRYNPESGAFTDPIRVNHLEGITAAFDMTVGKDGRIHVLIRPNPTYLRMMMPEKEKLKFFDLKYMLYTRLNDEGTAFEDLRDLSHSCIGFEGVGSVVTDGKGTVNIFFHGQTVEEFDEEGRVIYRVTSTDGGNTFSHPTPIKTDSVGSCQCCPMAGLWAKDGTIYLAYRAATGKAENSKKPSVLLASKDGGKTFSHITLEEWDKAGCPGSAYSLSEGKAGIFVGWRTEGTVKYANIATADTPVDSKITANTRIPVVVANGTGDVLFVWSAMPENLEKGASHIVYQVYDKDGNAISEKGVIRNGGAKSFGHAAAWANPDGSFTILYDGEQP